MADTKKEDQFAAQFPEKDWSKSTYSFTAEEKSKLTSLDTIAQIGQVSQVMINNLIQVQVLERIGVKNNPESKIIYEVSLGQFFIFTPRKKEEVKSQ